VYCNCNARFRFVWHPMFSAKPRNGVDIFTSCVFCDTWQFNACFL
jgi:hypothetical protein